MSRCSRDFIFSPKRLYRSLASALEGVVVVAIYAFGLILDLSAGRKITFHAADLVNTTFALIQNQPEPSCAYFVTFQKYRVFVVILMVGIPELEVVFHAGASVSIKIGIINVLISREEEWLVKCIQYRVIIHGVYSNKCI